MFKNPKATSVAYRLAAALAACTVAWSAPCAEPAYKPGGVYPSRPVRLIVPHAPGGETDAVARLMAQALSDALGQPLIVDNRAGEHGVAGTDLAAKSGNQGYTLLMTDTAFAVSASRFRRLPYDPVKDLIPVALIASAPLARVVQASSPALALPQLLAHARANQASGWYGLFAPAGTQWNIITHLADHAAKALERREVKEQLAALGAEGVGSDPEAFKTFIGSEMSKWKRAAKAAGSKLE
jgi:tripartite-type tricarboxylate transporter receptor subunit TctC